MLVDYVSRVAVYSCTT